MAFVGEEGSEWMQEPNNDCIFVPFTAIIIKRIIWINGEDATVDDDEDQIQFGTRG